MRTTALLIATTMVVLCAWSPAWGRNWVVTTVPDETGAWPGDLQADARGYPHCLTRSDVEDYGDLYVTWFHCWEDASGWHREEASYGRWCFSDWHESGAWATLALSRNGSALVARSSFWWTYDLVFQPGWFDGEPFLKTGASPPSGTWSTDYIGDGPHRKVPLALDANDRRHMCCG